MLTNVLTIVVSVLTGVAVPMFGYLKYRAYTDAVRHVVDKVGVDGLKKLGVVSPPPDLTRHLPLHRNHRRD